MPRPCLSRLLLHDNSTFWYHKHVDTIVLAYEVLVLIFVLYKRQIDIDYSIRIRSTTFTTFIFYFRVHLVPGTEERFHFLCQMSNANDDQNVCHTCRLLTTAQGLQAVR